MPLIRFMLKHSPRLVVLAVLAGLIGGAASTALLAVINTGLDRAQTPSQSLFFSFLGLAGLAMATRATSALVLASIGENAMLELRLRISRQIMGVPLRRLEEAGMPRLLTIMTDDVLNILNAVANVPVVCINAASVVTCLVFLGWLSWSLFLIVIGLIFLLLLTAQIPFMAASRHFGLSRKEHDTLMGHLRAIVSGIKELKVNRMRRQAFMVDLEASAGRYRDHMNRAMRIAVIGATWGEMLSFLTIGSMVFVVPRFMHVPNATLLNFVVITLYLMEPILFLQNQAPQFAKGVVGLKSIEEMGLTLGQTGREEDLDHAVATRSNWQRIDLRDVVFSYPPQNGNGGFVLGPINLTCAPGELLFVTGGNGSGKTTLGKVLVGLYDPDSGQVLLDGQPVTDGGREEYRQLFATVFADFFLFERLTGAERLNLDQRAAGYLRRLQLDQKVHVTDGVLSTLDLSQGQRKRLALLAAYMEDRPIFLFDEWAADQDPAFKELFYQELLPELRARGKAVLVISHDDRYYDIADRVIKLDDGRLVDDVRRRALPAAARRSAPEGVAAVSGARHPLPMGSGPAHES